MAPLEPRKRMRSVQAGTRRFSLVSYSHGFFDALSNWTLRNNHLRKVEAGIAQEG